MLNIIKVLKLRSKRIKNIIKTWADNQKESFKINKIKIKSLEYYSKKVIKCK